MGPPAFAFQPESMPFIRLLEPRYQPQVDYSLREVARHRVGDAVHILQVAVAAHVVGPQHVQDFQTQPQGIEAIEMRFGRAAIFQADDFGEAQVDALVAAHQRISTSQIGLIGRAKGQARAYY